MKLAVRTLVLSCCILGLTSIASAFSIEGTWRTDCVIKPPHFNKVGLIALHKGRLLWRTAEFMDEKCSDLVSWSEMHGAYVTAPVKTDAEQLELDFHLDGFLVGFHAGWMVDYMNSITYCGIDSWKPDAPLDISGANCNGHLMPAAGDWLYDVVQRQGEGLIFGKTTEKRNGRSPEGRPELLNEEMQYLKLSSAE